MSLPYYRFFPGDYARDTRHLSILQHGAYRLLIDLYMDTGGPLRNDLQYLYRFLHAESIEEKAAVEFVLGEFFELSTGKKIGWIHKRCDEELEWRTGKVAKASESARQRWVSERNANALRTQSEGNAIQNHNQITTKPARESWWKTEGGIEAKGRELGIPAKGGESYAQYRDRLFASMKAKA